MSSSAPPSQVPAASPTRAAAPVAPPAASGPDRSEGWARTLGDVVVGLVPLVGVSAATWLLFGLPASYLAATAGLYLALGGLLVGTVPADIPGPGMGPANRITLLRAVLILAVTGLLVHPGPPAEGVLWWIVGVSTLSMVLDGFDGWVARRTGTSTEFGARFDMELDAFLMLVLSGLVLEGGKAGAWVLLIGLLRYLFVAAGWIWPRLRGRLPHRFRRKLVCVVQGVALLVALAPMVAPTTAAALTGGALAALAYSFAADVAWLARRR